MADGRTRSIECPSLVVGRMTASKVPTSTITRREAPVVWRRFPKDTALLILVHRTLRPLLKHFRAAAGTKHRRSLFMQANIFARKEQRCTARTDERVQLESNLMRPIPSNVQSGPVFVETYPFSSSPISSFVFPFSSWNANHEVSQSAKLLNNTFTSVSDSFSQ